MNKYKKRVKNRAKSKLQKKIKENTNDNILYIFDKVAASFIFITGVFVILSTTGSITGNIIGNSATVASSNIGVLIWGLVCVLAGTYIWIKEKE